MRCKICHRKVPNHRIFCDKCKFNIYHGVTWKKALKRKYESLTLWIGKKITKLKKTIRVTLDRKRVIIK